LHIDDATTFLVDFLRRPHPSGGYSSYGYEIYLPNVVTAYLTEVEKTPEHLSGVRNGTRARDLSPHFYDAAWDLCRRGVLRPSVKLFGGQAVGEGEGYSITELGRSWLEQAPGDAVILEPGRLGQVFSNLAGRLGKGFLQRANEASRCHAFGLNLSCCAMSGAATESILLAVAIAKSGDEAGVMKIYEAAHGRRKIIEGIVGQARTAIAGPFRSATGLLTYWRDDAAHGLTSNISEIEAHEALSRLLRFAQFANDNWTELTA
jgi:hypothetical protein